MNIKTPTLRQHADGRWITKWAGKIRYLGRDQSAALGRYAEELDRWHAWREKITAARTTPTVAVYTVEKLYQRFLNYKIIEGHTHAPRFYRNHLRRFVLGFSHRIAGTISVHDLQSLKTRMLEQGKAANTINHDIVAVRSMFSWGMDQELIPPVNLRGCKKLPLGPPPDKALSVPVVRRMVQQAPQPVRSWLAVNYLAACRPSEVVRLVNQQCRWVEVGVIRLDVGKSDRATRQPRHIVLSDRALYWLESCRPAWSRHDSYSRAVTDRCDHPPGVLRHSAATHLLQNGVTRECMDALLGHSPGRISLTYARIDHSALRSSVAQIDQTLEGLDPED